jgi:hypothetical protein
MPRKPKMCKLCGVRPAEVPDRERLTPYPAVCRECHAERLADDIRRIWGGPAREER